MRQFQRQHLTKKLRAALHTNCILLIRFTFVNPSGKHPGVRQITQHKPEHSGKLEAGCRNTEIPAPARVSASPGEASEWPLRKRKRPAHPVGIAPFGNTLRLDPDGHIALPRLEQNPPQAPP